jgi:hypothetical protein
MVLLERKPEQVMLGEELSHISRELASRVNRSRARSNALVCEPADQTAQLELLDR